MQCGYMISLETFMFSSSYKIGNTQECTHPSSVRLLSGMACISHRLLIIIKHPAPSLRAYRQCSGLLISIIGRQTTLSRVMLWKLELLGSWYSSSYYYYVTLRAITVPWSCTEKKCIPLRQKACGNLEAGRLPRYLLILYCLSTLLGWPIIQVADWDDATSRCKE